MSSVDISELDKHTSGEDILKYIKKDIEQNEKSANKHFLLECCYWAPSNYDKNKWIAYSPITSRRSGNDWPIYSMNLDFADETEIVFMSWKDDYGNKTYHSNPYSNLPKGNKSHHFKGTVWTRGE